jgi:hypothetical protein
MILELIVVNQISAHVTGELVVELKLVCYFIFHSNGSVTALTSEPKFVALELNTVHQSIHHIS